jgi:hypothetical protein
MHACPRRHKKKPQAILVTPLAAEQQPQTGSNGGGASPAAVLWTPAPAVALHSFLASIQILNVPDQLYCGCSSWVAVRSCFGLPSPYAQRRRDALLHCVSISRFHPRLVFPSPYVPSIHLYLRRPFRWFCFDVHVITHVPKVTCSRL